MTSTVGEGGSASSSTAAAKSQPWSTGSRSASASGPFVAAGRVAQGPEWSWGEQVLAGAGEHADPARGLGRGRSARGWSSRSRALRSRGRWSPAPGRRAPRRPRAPPVLPACPAGPRPPAHGPTGAADRHPPRHAWAVVTDSRGRSARPWSIPWTRPSSPGRRVRHHQLPTGRLRRAVHRGGTARRRCGVPHDLLARARSVVVDPALAEEAFRRPWSAPGAPARRSTPTAARCCRGCWP